MSVRLTTSLSQRLVLTPQLRQRIEMLQMTTLELTDLIQQQLTENPVLEEVATQEEARELAEKILDHMASGGEIENFEAPRVEALATRSSIRPYCPNRKRNLPLTRMLKGPVWKPARSLRPKTRVILLKRSTLAVSFRITSIPVTRRRNSSTRKTRRLSSSF